MTDIERTSTSNGEALLRAYDRREYGSGSRIIEAIEERDRLRRYQEALLSLAPLADEGVAPDVMRAKLRGVIGAALRPTSRWS